MEMTGIEKPMDSKEGISLMLTSSLTELKALALS